MVVARGTQPIPLRKRILILILADCGGSNGNRIAAWKCALQAKLCDGLGLTVTVSHNLRRHPTLPAWNYTVKPARTM